VHVVFVVVGVGGVARPATLTPLEWFVAASADVGGVPRIAKGSAIRAAAAPVSARSASFRFRSITWNSPVWMRSGQVFNGDI
jgi:hypothetical protein